MEADLIARLLADSGLSALVDSRMNILVRPQMEALPAITLQKVAPGRAYTFSGADGAHGTLMQFDAWGKRISDVKPIMAALTAALEQPSTVGGTQFGMSFLQSERDSLEEVPGEGTIYRISADFLIWWQHL
ncbi:tail completion protein gp17 [Sphingobium baderi]|uniref:DUF3168 domain-containing protein n=1 Tax=Sphingobium baderi LL03 TaxID=1114964 RepID=T0GA23_9SPHN|nr:DUF3168 domain-containing protein [Sphingobium baderi]EQA96847.1 hypothetical protein L485_22465 [Sphingobium baderi LL03]KMS64138.1 hypothetical protein V475_20335 [Sphingobium baderi LL03]